VKTSAFTRIAGCDVSARSLQQAGRRLHVDRMSERQSDRIELFQGALTYEDPRFAGFDAAVLMEVVEHVDQPRLEALESVVFGEARPGVVVVTTPNSEYNALYEGLVGMRHPDHRFEWTRAEFAEWSARVASTYSSRDRRFAASPSFSISESPASWRSASSTYSCLPRVMIRSTRSSQL